MKRTVRSLTPAVVCLALAACGGGQPDSGATGSSTATTSGSGGATSTHPDGGAGGFVVGPHEPFPVVKNYGGPALATPTLITVTYAGYAYDAEADAFDQWIATSDWLAETGADYGAGKGSWLMHVTLPEAPPAMADHDDVGNLLEPHFMDGTLPDPAKLTDPLYVVRFPPATALTFFGAASCVAGKDIGGFHGEADHGGAKYSFAALPQCGTDAKELAGLEESSAHEVIEAVTDPFPFTDPGWALLEFGNPWPIAVNGEVGDLCQFLAPIVVDGHTVPRSWSNAAAKAGNPCVPVDAPPYFNASTSPSKIARVAAGEDAIFEVKAWSTAPMPAWQLETVAYGDFDAKPALGAASIADGQTTTLTLHVPAGTPSGAYGKVLLWSIADLAGGRYNFWPAVVQVK